MKINKNKSSNKKIAVIVALIIAAVILAVFIIFTFKNNRSTLSSSSTNSPSITPSNTSTPTPPATKDVTNSDKDSPTTAPTSTGTSSQSNTTSKAMANMVTSVSISYGVVSIRGGINNYSLSTGQCEVDLTGPNGQSVIKTTELLANSSTTDCKTVTISAPEITSGRWTYILKYSSDTIEGQTNENSFVLS